MEKRYNLGAGSNALAGYDNSFDLKQGRVAYPLTVDDNSADEIRASHLLEHFGHRVGQKVLNEWARALKPGGLLKVAVPDLEYIARGYLAGRSEPWQGYLCGGQTDKNDTHLAQYDEPTLGAMLRMAGLVGVHRWQGDAGDCSGLPVSLNLAAWKPPIKWPKVIGVMSVPRLGFMDNFFSAVEMLAKLRIPLQKTTGAFWGQCLTRAMERAIEEGAEWILTLDYDTVFGSEVVADLLATALFARKDISALIPIQMSRKSGTPLMTVAGEDGQVIGEIDRAVLDQTVLPIRTGHFGCSLLRVSALQKTDKPWFVGTPDQDNGWGPNRVDDDIHFWHQFAKAGHKAYCAPRCVVGHMELYVNWPNRDLEIVMQDTSDYWRDGPPLEVWR